MKIACPACGLPIPGADIDLASGRALCRPCGEVVPLPALAVAPPAAAPDALALGPAEALEPSPRGLSSHSGPRPRFGTGFRAGFRPDDLRLHEEHDERRWTFTLRPDRWAALPLLAFAAIWNGFLVFWYLLALGPARGGPGQVMLWFPVLHVAAGLYLAWQGLARLLDRTVVTLDPERFEVRAEPLPGRRVCEHGGNLLRFEAASRGPVSGLYGRCGLGRRFTVRLLTRDGRQVELPIDLPSLDHAAHVAHRLNHALDENRAPLAYRA